MNMNSNNNNNISNQNTEFGSEFGGYKFKQIRITESYGIGYVGLGAGDNRSVTVLDLEVLTELNTLMDGFYSEQGVGGEALYQKLSSWQGLIFYSVKPGHFLAGADIKLIASLTSESEGALGSERGQELLNKIEDLKIPTVACVDGVCLGGGLELALSCRHLIASNSSRTSLGLPEVRLGLLPGFGGTYRLPLRVELPEALGMILTGKQVNARKALKIGLVDEVYAAEALLEKAVEIMPKPKFFARKSSFTQSLGHFAQDNFLTRKIIFQKARENVLKETKGLYMAPLKILEVMENNFGKGRSSYLSQEAQGFGELCVSSQSKNLQHVFFLSEEAKKLKGSWAVNAEQGQGTELAQGDHEIVSRSAVVGAGVMGGGISWLLADNNQRPIMKDVNHAGLVLGLKQSSKNFKRSVLTKKLTADQAERKQRSITPRLTYDGFSKCDLVVEAIIEDMNIKKKVLGEVQTHLKKSCLLTSNTSSLSVTKLSEDLLHPENFAGLHFFNPVHRMPLVEIVTHSKVSSETVRRLHKWALQVKKTPVVVKDGPGFLVNRLLMPLVNESLHLLQEGVSMDELDNAVLNFGMPMGPCRLMDEVGLDVLFKVGKIMEVGLGERAKGAAFGEQLIPLGILGKKGGKGFYLYDDKGVVVGKNPEVEKLLPLASEKTWEETTIQMRVFLPMINEAARILEEGLVSSAGEVDLALIFGTGFPPFKGGLLKYADTEGLDRIKGALEEFSQSVSEARYNPAPLLKDLVNKQQKFYEWSAVS
jgi:3-hydroxyacyl-CoA dehydrogenase/enoyl-CoA hydratase/3-hydroxybutyryl-CoA epimerase